MLSKGLCITCADDKTCTFLRHFPVTQCEEFNGDGLNGKKQNCCARKSRIAAYLQEETIAE